MSKKTKPRKSRKKVVPAVDRTYRVMVRLLPEVRESLARLANADRRPLSTYASLVLADHATGKSSGAERVEEETP